MNTSIKQRCQNSTAIASKVLRRSKRLAGKAKVDQKKVRTRYVPEWDDPIGHGSGALFLGSGTLLHKCCTSGSESIDDIEKVEQKKVRTRYVPEWDDPIGHGSGALFHMWGTSGTESFDDMVKQRNQKAQSTAKDFEETTRVQQDTTDCALNPCMISQPVSPEYFCHYEPSCESPLAYSPTSPTPFFDSD